WKIKGSYVGKEAFNTYFGYPSSSPPVYSKAKAKARWKKAVKRSEQRKARAIRKHRYHGKKKPARRQPGVAAPTEKDRVG
ncbi:MAG: hypothetical protein ACM319_09530, partial [Deltaproteobacteria bacterium]